MIDVLAILANAGKVIGAAKTVKTVSTAVTEDREAKRKAKELNKNIATIEPINHHPFRFYLFDNNNKTNNFKKI